MGQENSKMLFTQVLKEMLRSRGAKVSTSQLRTFLQFVEEVCPWFPEEGTVSLETWNKVGERLQGYFQAHGPQKMPVETFSLWNLVRDSLDPRHEGTRMDPPSEVRADSVKGPHSEDVATAPPLEPGPLVGNNRPDRLTPKEEGDLEEAAAEYERERYGEFAFLSEECTKKSGPAPSAATAEEVQSRIQNLLQQMRDLLQGPGSGGQRGGTDDPPPVNLKRDPPSYPGVGPGTAAAETASSPVGQVGVRVLDPRERTMIALAQKGPDPILIWGRGHVCVFPQDAEATQWLQERLMRFKGNQATD